MNDLQLLDSGVRPLLDDNFRAGEVTVLAVKPYLLPWPYPRPKSLEALNAVVDEAMRCPDFSMEPGKSDAWLAPRIHATLRLTRCQASDRRLWNYLAIVVRPDYVRWRFKQVVREITQHAPLDRFLGEDSKNAFARLWWAAELTRNGSDYSVAVQAIRTTRFSVSWQALDLVHNRAAALAVCRFVKEFNDGKGATDTQSTVLAKAFNLRLTTLSLDALAPDPAVDAEAIREWQAEEPDYTKYMAEMPQGPDEELVPEERIEAVVEVLRTLAEEIGLAEAKRPPRKVEMSEESEPVDASVVET